MPLPRRTPEAVEPPAKPIEYAPPEVIRRLLAALDNWNHPATTRRQTL